ncbi:MAG: MBL fold metallo-hydrolase [Candidatus Saccharimonadales bacterium]
MEVQFFGANALRLTSKKASLVIDDNLAELGVKSITKEGDIALFTAAQHPLPSVDVKQMIDYPGEYEVSGVSIRGVAARAHTDEANQKSAVIYKFTVEDLRVVVLGHIYPDLSEEQLEALGTTDVLFVPIGGNGYTLDSIGALKLIRKIEPKLVIPTHFDNAKLNFPVPQTPLAEALKNMSLEPADTVERLKIKSAELPEAMQLIVLQNS